MYTQGVTLGFVAVLVFLLNLPFGYWRARVRRFSLQWMLVVPMPVPIVVIFRIISGLGWHPGTFPVMIGALFCGQYVGGKIVPCR